MVVVGAEKVTAPVTANVPVAVKLPATIKDCAEAEPLTVSPANCGVDVVVRF